jgi:hypothetical protein
MEIEVFKITHDTILPNKFHLLQPNQGNLRVITFSGIQIVHGLAEEKFHNMIDIVETR